jgi:mannose-6-phosphate isomerase
MEKAPLSAEAPHRPSNRTERPWGWFETLTQGDGYLVKRLRLRAGRLLSRQRHRHRCEHWVVVAGEGTIDCDGQEIAATVGTTVVIPVGGIHRASAGMVDLEIIEVQRGSLLSEEDIERFEDDFGRVVTSLNTL